MCNCIKNNQFNEYHKCFKIGCNSYFNPKNNKTCLICNWKKCNNNHCGCSISNDTYLILKRFYSLFCKYNNYSKETIYSLKVMLKTYYNNCMNKLL